MNSLRESELLNQIGVKGIVLDPMYPRSAVLRFQTEPEITRFWAIPDQARTIPYFVATMISLLDPSWQTLLVWKHLGSWNTNFKGDRMDDDVQASIYRGIGIKNDSADNLVFDRSELPMLVALIFCQLVFGWHVGDDIYVIPDNAQHIIKTDHHHVVHVSFRDEDSMKNFVMGMSSKGYQLPESLPDPTFKKPGWMK